MPDSQSSSPTLDNDSQDLHTPPVHLPLPMNRNGSDFISAAETEILDKTLLIPPTRPSLHQRHVMMRDALDRKKAALLLLASAQGDIETHASFMIEDEGLEETKQFYDAHYHVGDHYTAAGRFIKAVSSMTFKHYCGPVNSQVPDPTL